MADLRGLTWKQLRALAAGMSMAVLPAVGDSVGVDTPEDAILVEQMIREREGG